MKHMRFGLGLAAALCVLAGRVNTARAEFFTFTTTVNGGPSITDFYTGTNSVTLTAVDNQDFPHDNAASPAGTDIHFGDISNSVNDGTPSGDAVNISYSFVVTVTAYATATSTTSLGTGTFTIDGTVSGHIGDGQSNLSDNSFTSVSGPQTIGSESFTIASLSYLKPGASPMNEGGFSGHLVATPSAVPEPASLALLGVGLVGFAGRVLVRRKKAA